MGSISKTSAVALIALIITSSIFTVVFLNAYVFPKTLVVPDDYPTIQAAIGNASAGDTVFVKNGTYYYTVWGLGQSDGITIDKSISLIGENTQTTIIKPNFGTYYGALSGIHITADDVTISGFTIDGATDNSTREGTLINSPEKGYQTDGILIAPPNYTFGDNNTHIPSGCKIVGNIFINNGEFAISDYGKNDLISGNSITEDSSLKVIDNSGIFLNSSGTLVSNNTITGMGIQGIFVANCENVTIKDNNIIDNGLDSIQPKQDVGGLFLINWGHGSVYVYQNNITDNNGFGIEFHEANDCIIQGNNIVQNDFGVYLFNFDFRDNESNISSGNKLYYNNLVGNGINAFVEHSYPYSLTEGFGNETDVVSWDNGTVGNYWSDYKSEYPTATKIDSSGIGNTPYNIDKNNTDRYPLLQQVAIEASAPSPIPAISLNTGALIPPIVIPIVIAALVLEVIIISLLLYRRHRKTTNSGN